MLWCRKCSGHARQRLGPTLMNRRKPEKIDTKEYWEDVKTNPNPRRGREGGRSLPRMREGGKIVEQKSRVTRKECKRLREEFEVGGFMAQKGLWNIAKKRMFEDGEALPKEDGDLLREYQAMHEKNFLCSWPREERKDGRHATERLLREWSSTCPRATE